MRSRSLSSTASRRASRLIFRASGALVVIARNTAFTYKGKPLDVKTIGRELNVRYVLEGSVQRGGNRMRVNVQLIDAETGNHLWAERFDKPLADLFDMQDEIVARLAGALNTELAAAEARHAERTSNPDSMDLYFQGMACLNKGLTPDNVAQASSYFDRALAADPDNVDALINSARADVYAGVASFVTDPTVALAAAETKLTKALSAVPDHARAHLFLGFVDIFTRRAEEGIAKCEHALALDRNLANAHSIIGIGKIFSGRAEEAEAHIGEALRVSPRDTMAYTWMAFAGLAQLHLGSYEQLSRGFAERSRPTETIRYHISGWRPPWLNSANLTRRVSQSREASRSTRLSPSPAPAPPGRRLSTTPPIWPSSSPFSKACARPECRNNGCRPPPRRDPRRRLHGLLAPHERERGGDGTAVREHCVAQDVPDTLALRSLAKKHTMTRRPRRVSG